MDHTVVLIFFFGDPSVCKNAVNCATLLECLQKMSKSWKKEKGEGENKERKGKEGENKKVREK